LKVVFFIKKLFYKLMQCKTSIYVISVSPCRSVEEHLQSCGSDASLARDRSRSRSPSLAPIAETSSSASLEDVSDDSLDGYLETSNPFSALETAGSDTRLSDLEAGDRAVSMETGEENTDGRVKFYRYDSLLEEPDVDAPETQPTPDTHTTDSVEKKAGGVAIDTVRGFSGLDRPTVIGIDPTVNEDHADFRRFLLSLATRAKDNLIIITSNGDIKHKLDEIVT